MIRRYFLKSLVCLPFFDSFLGKTSSIDSLETKPLDVESRRTFLSDGFTYTNQRIIITSRSFYDRSVFKNCQIVMNGGIISRSIIDNCSFYTELDFDDNKGLIKYSHFTNCKTTPLCGLRYTKYNNMLVKSVFYQHDVDNTNKFDED